MNEWMNERCAKERPLLVMVDHFTDWTLRAVTRSVGLGLLRTQEPEMAWLPFKRGSGCDGSQAPCFTWYLKIIISIDYYKMHLSTGNCAGVKLTLGNFKKIDWTGLKTNWEGLTIWTSANAIPDLKPERCAGRPIRRRWQFVGAAADFWWSPRPWASSTSKAWCI